MRRKDDTLRDTLLDISRSMAAQEGLEAVNIRSIAKRAGVAAGTVYNYFSSKDDILLALTEEYWQGALEEMDRAVISGPFCRQLEEIFFFLRQRLHRSAGALMDSLGSVEAAGQARMWAMQGSLKSSLLLRLEADSQARQDIWSEEFTKEGFIRFLLTHMMALWRAEEPDTAVFFAVVRRILYTDRE